jgi:hypothetical protein
MKKKKSMKIKLFQIITLLIISLNINAQVELNDFPKNYKSGNCYMKNLNDSKWILIDCELANLLKNKELKSLQYKLKNLGYDIETSGCIDEKTILAFEKEKKQKKIRARNELREKRKRKKAEKKQKN